MVAGSLYYAFSSYPEVPTLRDALNAEADEVLPDGESDDGETEAWAAATQADNVEAYEELANWDFIKDNDSAHGFLDHLKRFPKGVTARLARAKLEAIVWNELEENPNLASLENFLAAFPDEKHSIEATELRDSLKAEADALSAEEERNG